MRRPVVHRGPTPGLDVDLAWPLDAVRRGNLIAPAFVVMGHRWGGLAGAAAAYVAVAVAMAEGRP